MMLLSRCLGVFSAEIAFKGGKETQKSGSKCISGDGWMNHGDCVLKPKPPGHCHQPNVLTKEPGHEEEEHRTAGLLEELGKSSQSHQVGSKPREDAEIEC